MAPSFTEMLSSAQFTFLLGDTREPVTVHAGIMSKVSEPLDRLINGSMKEAQEKCAALPHVDREIFLGLVEYAYRSDYNVLPCEIDPHVEVDSNIEVDMEARSCESWVPTISEEDYAKATTPEKMWHMPHFYPTPYERFVAKEQCPCYYGEDWDEVASHMKEQHVGGINYKHKDVFLFHAKMYCLADYYFIPALKELAISKLHVALRLCMEEKFVTTPERVEDIVALASFVYNSDNTQDHDTPSQRDALREEILGYIMAQIQHLELQPAFQKALGGEGQLAIDVISSVRKGLSEGAERIKAAIAYRDRMEEIRLGRGGYYALQAKFGRQ
ncbi:uncharacterized protein J4E88_010751 [Alternaria novae-zelandiae]|uniref:uncharacterized protein n=1 Tax=Alternaria novae-zelandiae TaxID=430562 RepID=UPI0020C1D98F|nr:uncharacterized protein J4E88_010751 [Alternaria novae-zelandiae]KAI4663901.1 hypothetical protein J4E88_010751 [Alternaria novae-zelandiae]